MKASKVQNKKSKTPIDYHQCVSYVKELRAFFNKEFKSEYKLGKLNHENEEYTYFSLTPEDLKSRKLKFVIIFDHTSNCFTICLSGQNKKIREDLWSMLKSSDFNKYHLAETINNSLMVISYKLVSKPNFNSNIILTQQIEKESLQFMNELREFLKTNLN